MNRTAISRSAALAAVAMGFCGKIGMAAEPTTADLLDQVKQLQTKVEQLETRQQAADVANQQPTASSVLNDASKHDNMLDLTGFTAGYSNEKFLLQSEDGNFTLHPWFLFQARDIINGRQDQSAHGDNWQNGFDIHRMKIAFDGNVFTPNLTYFFIWNTSNLNGNLVLSEAWARYKLPETPLAIKAGQFKNPFAREEVIPDQFQLADERTVLTDLLANGEGFVQGACLQYDNGGPLHADLAFTDGMRSANQDWQDFPTNNADFGVAGRVEYKLFGDWKSDRDFTALNVKKELLVLGGGFDYTEAGDTTVLSYTADAQYKSPSGLSAFGAILGRTGRHVLNGSVGTNGGTTAAQASSSVNDYGFELQAAYVLDGHWEPFARYSYINFDRHSIAATANKSTFHELTAGVNYYFYGHHAKLTTAVSYLPNGCPVDDEISGVLANNGHGEWLLRTQFQLFL